MSKVRNVLQQTQDDGMWCDIIFSDFTIWRRVRAIGSEPIAHHARISGRFFYGAEVRLSDIHDAILLPEGS